MPPHIVFLLSALEMGAVYGVMILLDRESRLEKKRLGLYLTTIAGIATMLDHFETNYSFVFIYAGSVLMIGTLGKGRMKNIAVDAAIACFVITLLQALFTVGIGMFYGDILEHYALMIAILLVLMFGTLAILRFCKWVDRWQRFYTNNRNIFLWIGINTAFVIIFLNLWQQYADVFWKQSKILLVLFLMNFLLAAILSSVMLFRKRDRWLIRQHQEFSVIAAEANRELLRQQHEYKNQINAIMGIAETVPSERCAETIRRYCEGVIQTAEYQQNPERICSEPVISAIVHRKKQDAAEKEIRFRYYIADPFPDLPIAAHDMTELLMNLLNNAFEASLQLASENREVFLRITEEGMRVQNVFEKERIETGFPKLNAFGYSTKGENRGYGLSNVSVIVKKYHLKQNMFFDGNVINIEILFQ